MALTSDVQTVRYGTPGNASQPAYPGPMAASTTVYGGAICLTNSSGNIKNASSPTSTDLCWGLVHAQTINSSAGVWNTPLDTLGNPFQVDTGSFYVSSGTGSDQLTQANVGQPVYVINETTVGATNGGLTRPVAGVLMNIDTTQGGGYAVQFGSSKSTGAPQ
jgi:hypothetical protein